MSQIDAAVGDARAHRDQQLAELKELLSIPSISTLVEHRKDVARAAEWLVQALHRAGMTRIEILPTPGHSVVYAERLDAGPDAPTVLVYGHYDVQPVDPLNEWVSAPFEPTVRGDEIFARGASDMKGQIFAQIKAVEALTRSGALRVNLKYLIEGEEEIGSPHLADFIDDHREMLRCDVVLNCDSGIHAPDIPSIVYALRGLAYFELEVRGPRQDLHSGVFGGTLHNPVQALCELIAGMHDAAGRVTLPGFYDKVRPVDPEERELFAQVPHSDEAWRELAGVPALWGEPEFSVLERLGVRPTLEINGIIGGFTGDGSKTVLPAKAMAKISMRLVAEQDSAEVYGQLCAYLREHAPDTINWEVRELNHGPWGMTDRKTPYMEAAVKALTEVFGRTPLFKREGGSVPIVGMLKQKLGVDTIMLGFTLPSDGIHGPNEKQYLPNFYRGIETYVRFLGGLR